MKTTKVLHEAERELSDIRTSMLALIEWHRCHSLKADEEVEALRGLVAELRAVVNSLSSIAKGYPLQSGKRRKRKAP